ncbi:DUF2851 family protein [Flavisolibacter nicotianae]|uniref:DUF2851 family protein n=1 Tax=Flavisolibacter nicotianae TaxID=2364882 RepID=UPI001F08EE38|nr:DUF2851 family protein [Flavisolibacter nicotianae]
MKKEKTKAATSLPLPFTDMGGERLLQFIWQFGYFNGANLTTSEGEAISILFPGTQNKNSGPDFTGAKIRIGETTFFGNVEVHMKTSDWEKHGHQADRQYTNVILHVVFQHDKTLDHAIPVLELEPRISTLLLERYNALLNADNFVPCGNSIATVSDLVWVSWKERLLAERLQRKAGHILHLLEESNMHWEETFWWLLARNFGMKVNSDAFEAVARSLSLGVLAKHRSSIHQVEALLFGQAGLLNEEFSDSYPQLLRREYQFLQKKLSLVPVPLALQFLRMRPGAFPTIRLAQLATLVHQSTHLFSRVVEAENLSAIREIFQVTANDFWHYHYTFHQASSFKKKSLGAETVDTILINAMIPILYAFGLYHKEERHKEKALRWLEELAPEKNAITGGFAGLRIKAASAFESQALIELKNEYCSHRKCLSCAIGINLLKRETVTGDAVSPVAAR